MSLLKPAAKMLQEVLCTLFLSIEITDTHKEVGGFSETHSGIKSHVLSQLSQCFMYSFTASATALISSNHQGKWRKQTVLGRLVMFKNNSSCYLPRAHHALAHVLCCVCYSFNSILSQLHRWENTGREKSGHFADGYTTVKSWCSDLSPNLVAESGPCYHFLVIHWVTF